jgi:hypothetical protein
VKKRFFGARLGGAARQQRFFSPSLKVSAHPRKVYARPPPPIFMGASPQAFEVVMGARGGASPYKAGRFPRNKKGTAERPSSKTHLKKRDSRAQSSVPFPISKIPPHHRHHDVSRGKYQENAGK